MRKSLLFTLLALIPLGCGKAAAERPGATGSGEARTQVPWSQKSHEQKAKHMAQVVVPEMKKLLVGFDPEEFPDVTCVTCHGENFREVNFKMPNGLHPLEAGDPIGSARAEDERMTRFMMEAVVPTMATLLDTEPYTPDNPAGLGCFNCHDKRG